MPRNLNQLTSPPSAPDWFRVFLAALNQAHVQIATELAKIQGIDGNTPQFYNSINVGANQITNVGPGTTLSDAPNVSQLLASVVAALATAVTLTGAQVVAGAKTWSDDAAFSADVTVTGDTRLNGDFGMHVAPVAQQTVDAITNAVTPGGVNGTIADYSSLTVYATDAAAIRDNIYQLARSISQLTTALRAFGLGV